ncbi:hypothetical protein DMA12_46760 [Amycolatopsis balhimycina DSM 5908]|uniref:Uncharacterized protein n=1 Tax=Amycolatopsis balhimycina DSM 5908 TaxID=1081091 RepID=A0A428VVF5_AMYBA|nr:hypothetical protein [Amycolatopsis balhimycina]RSM34816.1 hypothetical protein DMA12_46760 [Amycolatopsis balhimycina DSM 5908]
MTNLTTGQLWTRLTELLAGARQDSAEDLPGAELVVTEDDREVFRAALARHARRDRDEPAVIWIRPLVASAGLQDGLPVFDPSVVRRRALHVAAAQASGDGLNLELVTGQRARIQPACGVQLAVLQDFDTWMTTLTLERRSEVEALDSD